jgi:carbamate kinase
MKKRCVLAVGGNSLVRDKEHQSLKDQYEAAHQTVAHVANMLAAGWEVGLSHGNGPQVGAELLRGEIARAEVEPLPLDIADAETQGIIAYALQQNLQNILRHRGLDIEVASVITQVEVDPKDIAFSEPTKPIGAFMDEEEAKLRASRDGWDVREDAGRGWRRVVASPAPMRIVEEKTLRRLVDDGVCVIAVGGGGIPVVRDENGDLRGKPAVIDKDLASAMWANTLDADLLLISTKVDRVALFWGTPEQQFVDFMPMEEVRRHLDEGVHFAIGSMEPKMRAALHFLEGGGREVIITDPDHLEQALAGEAGTHITRA